VSALGLGATFAGCARTWSSGSAARGAPAGPGTSWQRVTVRDARGESATLPTLLAGRPALLSLWAPWCQPCVRELPTLDRIAKRAGALGALVVGVAVGETPAAIASFPPVHRLSYPLYADETFALADALGQKHVPATLVLDGAGRVVYTGAALDRAAVEALRAAIGPAAKGFNFGDGL
jgi:thiol-disulfide isomerase/thioredoxin